MKTAGLLVALVACKSDKAKPPAPAPIASTIADAALAEAGPEDFELIAGTGALVEVSSMVDNNHDLPEHIADHDPSTAWNGRTGDLVGGWVGVRLAHDRYVHYATIVVGFDKKTDSEDLFTANHRITRVRVDCMRDDLDGFPKQTLREVALDPEVRGPQRVLVDAFCWDLKLVVIGVKPGTHEGWRELAVSEFAVYGWEKGEHYHGHPSFMVDDSFPKNAWLASAATYEEACKKVIADEDERDGPFECGSPTSFEKGPGAILEMARIPYSTGSFRGELLGFKTAAGAFVTYVSIGGASDDEVSKTTYRVKSRIWRGSTLVLDIQETYTLTDTTTSVKHVVCHAAKEPWCLVT